MRQAEYIDINKLLLEIRALKSRIIEIEECLCGLIVERPETYHCYQHEKNKPFSGHKTKYGTYVDSVSGDWLYGLLNNSTLTLYKETIHHAKCCMCRKSDISLTAKTYRYRNKDYIIPLCDDCTHKAENMLKPVKEKKRPKPKSNFPRAKIYYNAVETKRRKF